MRTGISDYGLTAADVSQVLSQYVADGFGYASYPVSTANVGDDYGISLASPCWVYQQIAAAHALQLINYTEKGWDNHQDVVACLRVAD